MIHWSAEGFVTHVRPPGVLRIADKPRGALWVSDESEYSWRDWCFVERYKDDLAHVATQVVLDPQVTLRINSLEAFAAFDAQYSKQRFPGIDRNIVGIDWGKVALEHAAVVISPYRSDHRLGDTWKYSWYWGWDCASGAVLDPSAVLDLIPRPDVSWAPRTSD